MKRYFEILSREFPLWLLDYINTPEMQRLKDISQACGTDYVKLYRHSSGLILFTFLSSSLSSFAYMILHHIVAMKAQIRPAIEDVNAGTKFLIISSI